MCITPENVNQVAAWINCRRGQGEPHALVAPIEQYMVLLKMDDDGGNPIEVGRAGMYDYIVRTMDGYGVVKHHEYRSGWRKLLGDAP